MRSCSWVPSLLLITISLTAQNPTSPAQSEKARAASREPLPGPGAAAMKTIDPERIRYHVKFLADDLLEGRGSGQRGGYISALYISTQFALEGLKPAGDDGTYFQTVPLVGVKTQPESTVALVSDKGQALSLRLGDDAVAMDETQNAESLVDAPLVFVGYGIDAPEYKWNDFKNVDVRGKVLLALANEPPSDDPNFFNGKALTYYGRWIYKFEEAARKGARGMLLVHKTEMASVSWNVVRDSRSVEQTYLREDGSPKLKLAGWIRLGIAEKLAEESGKNLAQMMADANSREFRPVALSFRVRAHMVSKVRLFDSVNVIAVLPGSDLQLKNEAVLYTAHWDHLGMNGDNIYHGAIDNGTGCGILMEIARAYAASSENPKRSILFAAVTAEEGGLRGSEYLSKHLPVEAGKVTLALNFDAVVPYGVPEELQVLGAERTSFYPIVAETAADFDFRVVPDSLPNAGLYYRSDHFSLARVGVPAFTLSPGFKFEGHPREWGEQLIHEYIRKDYHRPSDRYDPSWNFAGNAKMARLGFALGWKAANQPNLVQWKPGDEFEAARKASEASRQ